MSNVWGKNIKVSLFGESHGAGIGVVLGGLPAGEDIDIAAIAAQMQRRAPGQNETSTTRREMDEVEVLSGLFNGKTTGAPVCGIIRNHDTDSTAYTPNLPRPGHADLTAHIKYKGFNDYRGGGHFSGRLTAPLTFVGSLAKQLLARQGIFIGSHIQQIADVCDTPFITVEPELLQKLEKARFPLLDESMQEPMREAILATKAENDSVGGIIECAACGILAGVGSPFFESLESTISAMMFAIPAVKGIEFGSGFDFALMRGSEANDEIYTEAGIIKTLTNHSGGINGGIANGMPLVFRVVIRPTPSIGIAQKTVNLATMQNTQINIQGRHDPCIVPRAAVVVEAALALCLLDALLESR